jgi:hypothetical protein
MPRPERQSRLIRKGDRIDKTYVELGNDSLGQQEEAGRGRKRVLHPSKKGLGTFIWFA